MLLNHLFWLAIVLLSWSGFCLNTSVSGFNGTKNTLKNIIQWVGIAANHLSIGDTSNIKKIMNEEGVSVEYALSVDSLQQVNTHLEICFKDLETINTLQSKTIKTMQLLIDTLSRK